MKRRYALNSAGMVGDRRPGAGRLDMNCGVWSGLPAQAEWKWGTFKSLPDNLAEADAEGKRKMPSVRRRAATAAMSRARRRRRARESRTYRAATFS